MQIGIQNKRYDLKKILYIFILALFTIASLLSLVLTNTVYGVGDDYPAQWRTPPKDSVVDSWGYYNRNCTSFAAWALHSRNGFTMPWAIGHAGTWGVEAPQRGYSVNMTPAVGSIAWWNNTKQPNFGHVAWVESVNGSNVIIQEYNYNNSGAHNRRTIAANSVSGYIHFKDIKSAVTVSKNADGRLEAFAINTSGSISSKSQITANGNFNSEWNVIPAGARDVASAVSMDNRIELFHVGNDGAVWHRAQTTQNGNFGAEQSLGGNFSPAIAASKNADGRIEVFAVGTNGVVYSKSQVAPNGGFNSNWNAVASNAKDIAAITSMDGRIEIFYAATDNTLRHKAQTSLNGNFGVEYNYGGNLRGPITAERNADGRIEVFALTFGGNILTKSQAVPNGSFNSNWNVLYAGAKDIAAARSVDNRIELFYVGNDGGLWHRAQTTQNGNFGAENNFGGTLR